MLYQKMSDKRNIHFMRAQQRITHQLIFSLCDMQTVTEKRFKKSLSKYANYIPPMELHGAQTWV